MVIGLALDNRISAVLQSSVLVMSQETDAKLREVTARYEREAKEAEARAQRPREVQQDHQRPAGREIAHDKAILRAARIAELKMAVGLVKPRPRAGIMPAGNAGGPSAAAAPR